MKSKTSFFNFTLVRKNIVRFSPIWITYLVIFIVGLPLIMGVTLSSQPADLHTTPAMDMAYYAGTVLEIVGPIAACIYGLCLAMALCSYLYSARSVGLYHSLPIRRSGLFGSNYLSGLLLIAGPNAIVALLAALVTLAGGGFCPGMLLAWFWACAPWSCSSSPLRCCAPCSRAISWPCRSSMPYSMACAGAFTGRSSS